MSEEDLIVEDHEIKFRYQPTKFAIVALLIVYLFLYQIVGGGMIVYLFGINPSGDQATAFRLASMAAEIMFILVPAYFLTRIQTMQWRRLLRVNKTDIYFIGLAVIGVISLEQLLEIYIYLQSLIPLPGPIEHFINQYQQAIEQTYKSLITANSPLEFIFVLLVIAVTPAICEEILFRGLVQGNFEISMSRRKAIVWTGIIFALCHFEITTLVALAVLGIFLSYLVSVSESILVPMAAHFTNNFISAFVLYASGKDSLLAPSEGHSLSVAYIIGWSLLLGLIFASTMRLLHNYGKKMREVKET